MSPETKKKGGVAERVREMAEPLARELGLSIWDVQFLKEGADWFLRIFIDKEDGVGIDDCVDMTHAIDPGLGPGGPHPSGIYPGGIFSRHQSEACKAGAFRRFPWRTGAGEIDSAPGGWQPAAAGGSASGRGKRGI